MGNEEAQMQDSMGSLIQLAFLSILFIFLILAAQFESFLDPLVIMFSLPLAIIGAAVALFISGSGIEWLNALSESMNCYSQGNLDDVFATVPAFTKRVWTFWPEPT